MRETSIESFHRIKENGVLTKFELLVYAAIFDIGPATIKEVCVKLAPRPETSISPVFARLERKGAIKTIGKRKCKITGYTVLNWDHTGGIIEPKSLKAATYHELKSFILDEYISLKNKCDSGAQYMDFHQLKDSWKNKLTTMRVLE